MNINVSIGCINISACFLNLSSPKYAQALKIERNVQTYVISDVMPNVIADAMSNVMSDFIYDVMP